MKPRADRARVLRAIQWALLLVLVVTATLYVSHAMSRALALTREDTPREVYACIRSEDVTLERGEGGQSSARNRLAGVVLDVSREGAMVRVTLDCGFPLLALVTAQSCRELGIAEGAPVSAVVKAPAIHLVARG